MNIYVIQYQLSKNASTDDKKKLEEKIMSILSDPRASYDPDHALILSQMHGFTRGTIYLYEKKALHDQVVKDSEPNVLKLVFSLMHRKHDLHTFAAACNEINSMKTFASTCKFTSTTKFVKFICFPRFINLQTIGNFYDDHKVELSFLYSLISDSEAPH